jgi:hypothetical protein
MNTVNVVINQRLIVGIRGRDLLKSQNRQGNSDADRAILKYLPWVKNSFFVKLGA